MSIHAINGATPEAASTKDRKSIAENFDMFLKLLTTQLKNQNPLEPLKTSEFTQQMVAFTSVEQQVKANKNLESLGNLFRQASLTSTVSYIGKTVTAEGDMSNLANGSANWDVKFDDVPEESKVTIKDVNGKIVYIADVNFNEGINSYSWNGQKNNGSMASDGLYTINIQATNPQGNIIDANTLITGLVTGVDMTGHVGVLNLGNRSVNIENVKKIEA